MRFSLHSTEFRVFVRCINALGKLGNEIYFECLEDGLVLKTVNSSRSAYAAVNFKNIFFEKVSDTIRGQVLRFKISSRSCCNIFKASTSLEKAVNKCRILISPGDTVLVVQFFCRYGIVKTFNMAIIDCEHLEAVYSLEQSANHLVLSTRILNEILNNFRQSIEEITVIFKDGECTFQNYILEGDPNAILTQLPLEASEFDAYIIGAPSELTFCQKELRALLTFCELVSPTLRIYCDHPGRPIIFACAHETRLSARFVLATLPGDAYSSAANSQRSQPLQPHAVVSKTPVQIKRLTSRNMESNILPTSQSVLPDFLDDAAGDEVTLLGAFPNAATIVKPNPEAHDATMHEAGDIMHTQLVQPVASPHPPPRPFSVHRLRESVTSPLAIRNASTPLPPVKKARSTLFSYIESDGVDLDSVTVEAMDLELQELTRRDDTINKPTENLRSTQANPRAERTVLVADSDDEC
ncbi:unnamed protein product [Calicophoron daubneyi]|uniref:Cell cycle checkpoint control protein RAD9A n=1 Tax=Calicophoron daubneyi TaxID=300641 RepID=A0AAV2TP95_CALDB